MYETARQNQTQRHAQPRWAAKERDAQPGGVHNGDASRGAEQTLNMAELAVRGTTALFDIQLTALRGLWQLQARSAAAFGAPDYSDLLRSTENGTQRLLSTSAEQVLTSARQAADAITEMQSQFGRLIEQSAHQLTDEIQHGIEEISQRAQEGLHVVKEMAEQGLHQSNGTGTAAQRHAHEAGTEQVAESLRGEYDDSHPHADNRGRNKQRSGRKGR